MKSPGAPAAPPKVAYISFSAEINPMTTEALLQVCAQLANGGTEEVALLLSTPGGGVMNGINIYNVLRAMPFKLTTHNVGNVDSIGNVIFLAGTRRLACANSSFMFHGVGATVQNARLEEQNLKERLGAIQADNARISAIICERSRISVEEARSMFLEQITKNASWAQEVGIVHEVCDVQIPPGVPVHQLIFQR